VDRRWLCSAATLRGDRRSNQDQLIVVDGAAAVLDGATSWLRDSDDPRDGGWYARVLGAALTGRLPGRGSLVSLLADAITEVRDTYSLAAGDSPYSTASMVRWASGEIELLVLGDSPALVRDVPGVVDVVADERLSLTASAERDTYREHLAAGHGFDVAFADLVAAVQRSERDSFNRPGGFWVAEAEPAAAEHAVTKTWSEDQVGAVALMTDGASAAVTDYGLIDWPDLLSDVSAHGGVSAWLAKIHAAETTDPDGRRWPRTKKHDDKSLVIISRLPE
jgi:hypothetical protein